MNKKSQVFMILLVVATLVTFTLLYFMMLTNEGQFEKSIGERQFSVMKAATEADKALYYIDLSADYAIEQAMYGAAQIGGSREFDCLDYAGFRLMNNNTRFCFPDYEKGVLEELDDELNLFLISYPEIYLPISNYEYMLEDKELRGTARIPVYTEYGKPKFMTLQKSSKITEDVVWPSKEDTVITSCFGPRNVKVGSKDHKGVDMRAERGEPIFAPADGKVKLVKMEPWGNIILEHEGFETKFLHCSAILRNVGDVVEKGDLIARAGDTTPTGTEVPVHIHFELHKNGIPVDPIEDLLKIDELDIHFDDQSNCVYNINNYAYKAKIEQRVVS